MVDSSQVFDLSSTTLGIKGSPEDWMAYRFGKMWTLDTIPKKAQPIDWIVYQMLPRRSLAMFYGLPGHAKSLIVMDMCMCAAAGKPWLGRGEFWTKKSKILWMDVDQGSDVMNERLIAMHAVHGVPDMVFNYYSFPTRGLNLSRYEDVEDVIKLVKELGSEVVVFDTFKRVAGDISENSSDIDLVLGAFRRVMSETGCSVIAIHHANKGDGEGQTRMRGSTAIAGGVDNGFFVEYIKEVTGPARFQVTHEKFRRTEPVRPFEFRIESKKDKQGATVQLNCSMFETAKGFVGG
jgi:RecA-family ATPase